MGVYLRIIAIVRFTEGLAESHQHQSQLRNDHKQLMPSAYAVKGAAGCPRIGKNRLILAACELAM